MVYRVSHILLHTHTHAHVSFITAGIVIDLMPLFLVQGQKGEPGDVPFVCVFFFAFLPKMMTSLIVVLQTGCKLSVCKPAGDWHQRSPRTDGELHAVTHFWLPEPTLGGIRGQS